MRPAPDRASQHRLPSGIRDNLDRGKVGDFLKAHIQSGANLAMVSAYFTLAGCGQNSVNKSANCEKIYLPGTHPNDVQSRCA